MAVRVLLADNQPVIRADTHTVLEQAPDIQIVGEARDGEEAQQLTAIAKVTGLPDDL